jgi:asparagine synthase (glutamine-hydrolysing)
VKGGHVLNARGPGLGGYIDLRYPFSPDFRPKALPRSVEIEGGKIYWRDHRVQVAADSDLIVLIVGAPRFVDTADAARHPSPCVADAFRSLYVRYGPSCVEKAHDSFALVIIDLKARCVAAAVDRFAVYPLCYSFSDGVFAFADHAAELPLRAQREIEPQGLLEYFYFHVIPAPRTIFKGVQRLDLGHFVVATQEGARVHKYWHPAFQEESKAPFAELKSEFRQLLETAVARELGSEPIGAFLSGGTDSSTIAGLLGKAKGSRARTFSIGFEAQGYDEMAYARIAARHFGTEHHEYYVTPEDLLRHIPDVAQHYDQPFANSSALAAYCCSRAAKDAGIAKLLAGDGGDELFGGNIRYAEQRIFEAYKALPRVLQEWVAQPVLRQPITERLPIVRKAASYVRQAQMPMPARINRYNLLLRLGINSVLSPSLLELVDVQGPALQEAAVYNDCAAESLTNRMLAFDWKYTLADNDLPKVRETAYLAGISVGFPMLSDKLVDFSLRLAPELKVRGLRLRWFFKEALRDFLPEEIIRKKKHGFGLPFGPWMVKHESLFEFAAEGARALASRGIVRTDFVEELLTLRLRQHPGYYGEMVWIIVILEHWLREHAANFAVEG